MTGWAELQSYGPANNRINAEGVEAIRQQLNKPQPLSSIWIPVESILIATGAGATSSIAETTVSLQSIAGVIIPHSTAAAHYIIDATTGNDAGDAVTVAVKHKPAGSTALQVYATTQATTQPVWHIAGLVDINSGRLTYQTTIVNSPLYTFSIRLTGFLRAGALV